MAQALAHPNLGLTPEQRGIAELAFELGQKYGERRFDEHEASMAQWDDLAASGLTALSIPEEYGGAGGMFELILAAERLSAGGFPAAKLVIATAIAGSILARSGSSEQKQRWLPGVAEGTTKFCFGFTEPGAGSNARNLRTTAAKTSVGWQIRGEKTYISALESSDAMLLVAKDASSGGLSVFAFPLPQEGVAWSQVNVEAPAFEFQWNVFFDFEVGDDALIGSAGAGGKALFDGLNPERLIVAAQGVGIGRWCLERARSYAATRVVFDVPIGAHQAIQHPLAEALIGVESAWLLLACDAGLKAADRALQTFGGSGFTDETMILQRFMYMRLLQTIPVARELALNHIATAGLGLPRSY